MKNIKKIIATLLTVSIALFAFAGCSGAGEKEYLGAMEEKMNAYSTELTTFANLLGQAKFGDADWAKSISDSDEKLDSLGAEIKALEAPKGYESIHDKISRGIDKISEGTELTNGVTSKAKSKQDVVKYSSDLTKATSLFNEGAQLFREAASELSAKNNK